MALKFFKRPISNHIGLLLSIIIVLLIILSITIYGIDYSLQNKTSKVKLNIIIDDSDVRVNECFNLTLNSISKNANVTWILPNGNLFYGLKLHMNFTTSNYYNVSVKAKWENNEGYGYLLIVVKNEDISKTWKGLRIIDYKIFKGHGYGEYIIIPKGISTPTFYTHVIINNLRGIFNIYGTIFFEDNPVGVNLFEEKINGFKKMLNMEKTFTPDKLPDPNKIPYEISVVIHCEEGYCGQWEVTVASYY